MATLLYPLQDADRIVPCIVQQLQALPSAWNAQQLGPLQAQHDMTRLQVALRA
jgi:hypothetical protein